MTRLPRLQAIVKCPNRASNPSSQAGEVLFFTTRVRPTSRPFHLTHASGLEAPKWRLPWLGWGGGKGVSRW